MLNHEFKFKTDIWLELFQVEIPLPHLLDIGQRLPNSRDRCVKGPLDHNRFRNIIPRSHISSRHSACGGYSLNFGNAGFI